MTRFLGLAAACAAGAVCPAAASAISSAPDAPGYSLGGFSPDVDAVTRLGDTIYIGGSFSSVNGQPRSNLAAISAVDGSLMDWAPTAPTGTVWTLAGSGSTIYIGGSFSAVNGSTRNALAAVDTAGTLLSWNPDAGIGASAYALAVDGSRVYVGGSFFAIGGVPAAKLAQVNAATGAANPSWTPNPSNDVLALAVAPDGAFVYAGGGFLDVGSTPRNGLAALRASDGALDPDWDPSGPSGGSIQSISVAGDNSQVYVSGDFFPSPPGSLTIGGAPRAYAASVQPAGNGSTGTATAFAPDADSQVNAIAASGSAVYIGGLFTLVRENHPDQVTRNHLAAVDSTTGAALPWDPHPNDWVYSLYAGVDGSVYTGGKFTAMTLGTAGGFASFSLAPAAVSPPAISGTPQPGQTVTCVNGVWSGSTPQTYTLQFLRDGAAIPGGPADSYTVADGDAAHSLTCRVTAANRAGSTGADSAAVGVPGPAGPSAAGGGSGPPPALSPPLFRKSANLFPVSGTVLLRRPGASAFTPILAPTQIPFGSIVDATGGRVRICTADAAKRVQCADFFGGRFKLVQLRGKPPITELILTGGSFRACPKLSRASTAARKLGKQSTVRQLWGDGTGSFRTRGRFAAATIRGTRWLTADRCDGTLVRVVKGSVTVRDLVKRKSLVVKARKRYLARP